jgi:hypothetical protein
MPVLPGLSRVGNIWDKPPRPDRRWIWRLASLWLCALAGAIGMAWVMVELAVGAWPF